MEDYRERVSTEKEELEQKKAKLAIFLESDIFGTLSKREQILLQKQSFFMTRYCDILNERIQLFKE